MAPQGPEEKPEYAKSVGVRVRQLSLRAKPGDSLMFILWRNAERK